MTPTTKEELEAKMWSTQYLEYPTAWQAFVDLFITENMHYGRDELNTAWYFYHQGWMDAQ